MNTAEIMKKGWFKMPRTFEEWAWYGNSAYVHMYLHLMMKANYKPKEWQDTVVERGEVITSLDNLAKELNLSVKQVRNVLDKLQKTNYIEKNGTNKYTRIKIVNYDIYQCTEPYVGIAEANQGQTEDNQRATTKKEYKEKKDKNDISYGYRPRKNFFNDYDDEVTEFELQIMRERMERYRG